MQVTEIAKENGSNSNGSQRGKLFQWQTHCWKLSSTQWMTESKKRAAITPYVFAAEWLAANEQSVVEVLAWLNKHGGYCDCEVVANAADHWEQYR